MNARFAQRRAHGFTLVEMLVVMVLIVALLTIASPAYQDALRKSRRTDGKAAVTSMAQTLERCMTQFGAYDDADCRISAPADSERGYYRISVVRSATTFTVTATAQNAQAGDSKCSSFTIDQLGVREATNSACW